MAIEHEFTPSLYGASLQTVILLQRGESSISNFSHQVNKPRHHEQTQAGKLQNESTINGIFTENNEEQFAWPQICGEGEADVSPVCLSYDE